MNFFINKSLFIKLKKMLISRYEQLINTIIKNLLTMVVKRVLITKKNRLKFPIKITILSMLRLLKIVV